VILQSAYPPALPDVLWQTGYDAARESATIDNVDKALQTWSLDDPLSLRRLLDAMLGFSSKDEPAVVEQAQGLAKLAKSSETAKTVVDKNRQATADPHTDVYLVNDASQEAAANRDEKSEASNSRTVKVSHKTITECVEDNAVVHLGSASRSSSAPSPSERILGVGKPTKEKGPFRDELPVQFQASNPKRVNSASNDRYELYKVAKTVGEAKSRGATLKDIEHDHDKGYMKLLPLVTLPLAAEPSQPQNPECEDLDPSSPEQPIRKRFNKKRRVIDASPSPLKRAESIDEIN